MAADKHMPGRPDENPLYSDHTPPNLSSQEKCTLELFHSKDTIHIAYRGWFHPIEKLTLNGRTYISDEYPTYLNGYTVNNWPYASALMLIGVLCTSTVLFFLARSKRRQKLAVAAERAALDARPSPFARELAEDEI